MDPADSPHASRADLGEAAGAMREAWRAEEEEYARAAATQWAHGRRLIDIAYEMMHRGDTVAVTTGLVTFTGTVSHVGFDLLRVRVPSGVVDVNLATVTTGSGDSRQTRLPAPIILRVVARARAGGRRAGGGTETFRARLLEYEAEGVGVRLGSLLLQEELRGALTVGRDQVCIAGVGRHETYLPLAWVSWVTAARD
jgi:hypothetical protein